MPQFDQIDTFISQIFWLFVSFGIIYLFISRFVIPKINDVFKKRQVITNSDYEKAELFKNDAVEINARFEKQSAEVRAKSLELMNEASKKAEDEYNKALSSEEYNLKQQILVAEKEIIDAQDKAKKDLHNDVTSFVGDVVKKFADLKVSKSELDKAVKG